MTASFKTSFHWTSLTIAILWTFASGASAGSLVGEAQNEVQLDDVTNLLDELSDMTNILKYLAELDKYYSNVSRPRYVKAGGRYFPISPTSL